MARFLLLTQFFSPEVGAAQVRLLEVAQALRRAGHTVAVVTAMPNYPHGRVFPGYERSVFARAEIAGIPVIRTWVYPAHGRNVLKRLTSFCSFSVTSFFGCLMARRPDYLLVESPPLFLGLTAFLYSRLFRVPFILNVSDLWSEAAKELGLVANQRILGLSDLLERFVYRRAYRINVVTLGLAERLATHKSVPRSKLLWLPNGVNLDTYRPGTDGHELVGRLGLGHAPVFSCVGTHGQTQGMQIILDAAQRVGSSARFLLVGDGSEKPGMVSRARAMGLDNVTFLDPQPPDEVPRLMNLSRAALVTIRSGDMFRGVRPARMFPALGCGTPIIYSGEGEGAAIVQQADCGLVVPPGDADAIAQAVRELVADPERARRLGANGRALAEREYGWDAIVGRWLADLGATH
jgi:colanic acid biosynthesis glycosyl transferase WcaI